MVDQPSANIRTVVNISVTHFTITDKFEKIYKYSLKHNIFMAHTLYEV